MEAGQILKAVIDYGFVSVAAALFLFISIKNFEPKLKKRKELKTIEDLKEHHEIFSKIKNLINYQIPNYNFKNKKIRTLLFKDMMITKLECIKEVLLTTLDEIEDLDEEKSYALLCETLDKIVKKYHEEWERMGVPQVVIKKFDEWHLPRVLFISDSLMMITESCFLDTKVEKAYAILNNYLTMVISTIIDMERTLIDLNGDLSGKTYKGYTIE